MPSNQIKREMVAGLNRMERLLTQAAEWNRQPGVGYLLDVAMQEMTILSRIRQADEKDQRLS